MRARTIIPVGAFLLLGGVVAIIVVQPNLAPGLPKATTVEVSATDPAPHSVGPKSYQQVQPAPALTLADTSDDAIEASLQSLIAALDAKETETTLAIALAIRSEMSAVGTIREKLLLNGAIHPEAVVWPSRMVALALCARTPQLEELADVMLAGWQSEQLTEHNEKAWKALDRRPLSVLAADALGEPERAAINGLINAVLLRQHDAKDRDIRETWPKLWRLLRGDGFVADPLISVVLWVLARAADRKNVPDSWIPYFEEVRDDSRLSLRLRLQAAAAIAPNSENLLDLLENLAQSLGKEDAAATLSRYLSDAPELSQDDWSLILAALLNGRAAVDAGNILFDAFRVSVPEIRDAGKLGRYGDALVTLFVGGDGSDSLSRLAGRAAYALIVWSRAPGSRGGGPRLTGPRPQIFEHIDDKRTVAKLLALLDTDLFNNPDDKNEFVQRRIAVSGTVIRLLFHLRVDVTEKLRALDVVLSKCASDRERFFSSGEAQGSISGLDEADLAAHGDVLLARVLRLRTLVLDSVLGDEEGALAGAATSTSACINSFRVIHRIASLAAYPPLSEDQLEVLRIDHDLFMRALTVLRQKALGNDIEMKKVDRISSDFEKLEVGLAAKYVLPWRTKAHQDGED
ncbi:MAG: hypothetical protein IT464_04245 [Planctomycetes bacterium]|nr:hypothetical protein [Planctomycetota bacterium]